MSARQGWVGVLEMARVEEGDRVSRRKGHFLGISSELSGLWRGKRKEGRVEKKSCEG